MPKAADSAEKMPVAGQAGLVYYTNVSGETFHMRLGGQPLAVPPFDEEPYVAVPVGYVRVVEKYGGRQANGPLRLVQRRGGETTMQAVERTVKDGRAEFEAAKATAALAPVAPVSAPADDQGAEKLVAAERSVVALEIENTKLSRAAEQAKRETEAVKAELLKARQAAKAPAPKPAVPATE